MGVAGFPLANFPLARFPLANFLVPNKVPTLCEETVPEDQVGSPATILMVEDEDAMREVTRRILTRNAFDTIACGSGEEALERAGQHDGDLQLLLTDVVMPGMLGRELAGRLRGVRPAISVLYMSGYDHQTLTTQGILDPSVVLIPKPFSEPALVAKVREVLDGAR